MHICVHTYLVSTCAAACPSIPFSLTLLLLELSFTQIKSAMWVVNIQLSGHTVCRTHSTTHYFSSCAMCVGVFMYHVVYILPLKARDTSKAHKSVMCRATIQCTDNWILISIIDKRILVLCLFAVVTKLGQSYNATSYIYIYRLYIITINTPHSSTHWIEFPRIYEDNFRFPVHTYHDGFWCGRVISKLADAKSVRQTMDVYACRRMYEYWISLTRTSSNECWAR